MFHLRELIDANRKEIASLLSKEHGKVLGDALGEVARGLENIEFACGVPNLMKGGYSEQASNGIDVYSIKQPLGVCVGITPFNFPAMVPMWMFANALACGNTFVLKPSEKDPSTSMFVAELLKQAGLPDGTFNIINGDKVAVDRLLTHPDVQAISFVGSTPIARYIYETGTKNGKRVQALGGAKNHMLVLPDADLDMAADAAVSAAYGSAGERCMAISVVLASDAIADELVGKIKDRLPAIVVGPASEDGSEMGPLITGEHRDKVKGYVDGAPGEGATVVVDGTVGDLPADGFFLKPSLIDQRQAGHALLRRRDLWPGAQRHACQGLRRGPGDDQRQRVRQRHGDLHPRRRRCSSVRVRRAGRHGRHQRAGASTGQLLQLRWLEGQPVRRHAHVWSGGHQLLHPNESRDQSLAGPAHKPRRPRLPAEPLARDSAREDSRMQFGVVLQTTPPSRRVVDLAKRAESYGFDYVWTFDSHILWQEPYVIYSQILAETRNVIVGPMVTNPATRDWTVTASVYATLNEMFGNRTVCGIGRGDSAVRVTNGAPTTLATLRDSVHVIREMANGRSVEYKGSDLRLPWAAKSRLEMWIAAYGPKALALTGEVGDGFILQLADLSIAEFTIKSVRDAGNSCGAQPRRHHDLCRRAGLRHRRQRGGACPRARAVPLVRRNGRQPCRRHRRSLRRRCAGAEGADRLHQGPRGLRLQPARPSGQHARRLRARRDRRSLLHHRSAGSADRADERS